MRHELVNDKAPGPIYSRATIESISLDRLSEVFGLRSRKDKIAGFDDPPSRFGPRLTTGCNHSSGATKIIDRCACRAAPKERVTKFRRAHVVSLAMPRDSFNREIDYLRISVIDNCNLRCVYCMPLEGLRFLPREELLTPAEIERVVRAAVSVGFHKFRLTGGEPTLRADLLEIVKRIAALN